MVGKMGKVGGESEFSTGGNDARKISTKFYKEFPQGFAEGFAQDFHINHKFSPEFLRFGHEEQNLI